MLIFKARPMLLPIRQYCLPTLDLYFQGDRWRGQLEVLCGMLLPPSWTHLLVTWPGTSLKVLSAESWDHFPTTEDSPRPTYS